MDKGQNLPKIWLDLGKLCYFQAKIFKLFPQNPKSENFSHPPYQYLSENTPMLLSLRYLIFLKQAVSVGMSTAIISLIK